MKNTPSILDRIQPENNNVLVKSIDETIQKVGSIFVVNNAQSRNKSHSAEVIKTCTGSKLEPGDTLFFNSGAIGTEIRLETGNFKIMREADILVRLKKESTKDQSTNPTELTKSFKYKPSNHKEKVI